MAGPGKLLELYETIDARGWEPPQPLERMLETLEELPRGSNVVMLVHCEPRPLFRILKPNGFDYRCRCDPEGYFEVHIWRSSDTAEASAGLD
jgi:hypothetical protein